MENIFKKIIILLINNFLLIIKTTANIQFNIETKIIKNFHISSMDTPPFKTYTRNQVKTQYFTKGENKIKILNFKKSLKMHKNFKSLKRVPSESRAEINFADDPKTCDFIVIDEDCDLNFGNLKNVSAEMKSFSIEKKSCQHSSFINSENDCILLDEKTIDMAVFASKKIIKKNRFLNFKKKSHYEFYKNSEIFHETNNYPRIRKKFYNKQKKSLEHLQNLLKEISEWSNSKVSDDTLKTILAEINSQPKDKIQQEMVTTIENSDSDIEKNENSENFQKQIIEHSKLLHPKNEKIIRIGQKYQSKLPVFNQKEQKNILEQLEKYKVWESNKIKENEFEDCRKLIQNILKINSINEEILCELLAKNNYRIQDTVTYCFDNSKTLQIKLVEKFIDEKISKRKTRNSLFNKFC